MALVTNPADLDLMRAACRDAAKDQAPRDGDTQRLAHAAAQRRVVREQEDAGGEGGLDGARHDVLAVLQLVLLLDAARDPQEPVGVVRVQLQPHLRPRRDAQLPAVISPRPAKAAMP